MSGDWPSQQPTPWRHLGTRRAKPYHLVFLWPLFCRWHFNPRALTFYFRLWCSMYILTQHSTAVAWRTYTAVWTLLPRTSIDKVLQKGVIMLKSKYVPISHFESSESKSKLYFTYKIWKLIVRIFSNPNDCSRNALVTPYSYMIYEAFVQVVHLLMSFRVAPG